MSCQMAANSRAPLQDISESLRRSQRLNSLSKSLSGSTQAKAPLVQQKSCKVVSSKKTCLRRKRVVLSGAMAVTSSSSSSSKRPLRRAKEGSTSMDSASLLSESQAAVISLPPSLVEDRSLEFVCVRPEDEWLCQPSIAYEMYLHAKSLEARHVFSPDYLSVCGSRITNDMRATLVNWLVEIHGHMKLEPEVLHTAVRLLDACLQHFKVGVTRLQLCGLAVFWLATKLESRPLNAQDLLYLMCYKGDVSILVRMEQTVLKLLNFQMQVADPVFFLNRLMLYDDNGRSEEFFNTCTYCMDSILYDINVVEIPASELANAALLAGRLIDGRWDWPRSIGYATEHWPSPDKLRPLALKMIRTILEASNGTSTYTGAYKKYASRKRFHGLSESPKFSSVHLSQLIQILTNSTIVDIV